jgi:hypothetical protein
MHLVVENDQDLILLLLACEKLLTKCTWVFYFHPFKKNLGF